MLRFTKQQKLLNSDEFQNVFSSPDHVLRKKIVTVLVSRNQLDYGRLGIIVGKKNVKFSTTRNRLKRQIREAYRLKQSLLSGWDVVVIVQRSAPQLSRKEFYQRVDQLWDSFEKL